MHLFGHNIDHDYYFELPGKGSGIPNQFLGVLLHTIAMSGLWLLPIAALVYIFAFLGRQMEILRQGERDVHIYHFRSRREHRLIDRSSLA